MLLRLQTPRQSRVTILYQHLTQDLPRDFIPQSRPQIPRRPLAPRTLQANRGLMPASFRLISRKNQARAGLVTFGLHLIPSGYRVIRWKSQAQTRFLTPGLYQMPSGFRMMPRNILTPTKILAPGIHLMPAGFRMIPHKSQAEAKALAFEMHLIISIFRLIACERKTLAGHSKLCTTLHGLLVADDPTQQSISGLKDLDRHEEMSQSGVLDGIFRSVPHINRHRAQDEANFIFGRHVGGNVFVGEHTRWQEQFVVSVFIRSQLN